MIMTYPNNTINFKRLFLKLFRVYTGKQFYYVEIPITLIKYYTRDCISYKLFV